MSVRNSTGICSSDEQSELSGTQTRFELPESLGLALSLSSGSLGLKKSHASFQIEYFF